MATPANALGITDAGLVKFDGVSDFTGVTVTNHRVLVGAAGNGITSLGALTNGQLIIGSTGVDPVAASLTAGSGVTITPGAGSLTIAVSGSSVGQTITGNTGGALSPTSGNWNIVGTGSTTTSGSGSTLTAQLTGLTNHNILVGAGTATITNVAPSATSGVPLISQGAAADPAFGTAVVAGGGTGQVTLTNHGVLIGQATSPIAATAAGSAGQVLQSGGASADPSYSTATYPSVATGTGTILRANGTNWVATTATYPASSGGSGKILYDDGTNFVESTPTFPASASATTRKIIVSDGTNWVASTETWATPSTSGNVLTSNGTNWVSSAPAASGLTWSVITVDQSVTANNGYICNKAGLLTLTLPASSTAGDVFRVTGINTALGWKIAQNANQQIFFGTSSTTVGTGGSLASSQIRDSAELVCVTGGSSSVWQVISSIGNITVV